MMDNDNLAARVKNEAGEMRSEKATNPQKSPEVLDGKLITN
jgi:hypothetical protein